MPRRTASAREDNDTAMEQYVWSQIDSRLLRPYLREQSFPWMSTLRAAVRSRGIVGAEVEDAVAKIYKVVFWRPGELWGFDPSYNTFLEQRYTTILHSRISNYLRDAARAHRRQPLIPFSVMTRNDDYDWMERSSQVAVPPVEVADSILEEFLTYLRDRRGGSDMVFWFQAHLDGRGVADLYAAGWDTIRIEQRQEDVRHFFGVWTQARAEIYNDPLFQDVEQALQRWRQSRSPAPVTRYLEVRGGNVIPVFVVLRNSLRHQVKVRAPGVPDHWVDPGDLIQDLGPESPALAPPDDLPDDDEDIWYTRPATPDSISPRNCDDGFEDDSPDS